MATEKQKGATLTVIPSKNFSFKRHFSNPEIETCGPCGGSRFEICSVFEKGPSILCVNCGALYNVHITIEDKHA